MYIEEWTYMPDMAIAAQGAASFTGLLVRRQYRPGQKYIQLLFETSEGLWLTLTRDVQLVRDLIPGQAYEVQGPVHAIGNKHYVHEPSVVPVDEAALAAASAQSSVIARHPRLMLTGAALVVILLAGTVVALASHKDVHSNTTNGSATTSTGIQMSQPAVMGDSVQAADTSTGVTTDSTTTPATTPAATSPTGTTPQTTKPPASTPVVTEPPAATPDPAPATIPDPDPAAIPTDGTPSNSAPDSTANTTDPTTQSGDTPTL
jgi:hypothetical protein